MKKEQQFQQLHSLTNKPINMKKEQQFKQFHSLTNNHKYAAAAAVQTVQTTLSTHNEACHESPDTLTKTQLANHIWKENLEELPSEHYTNYHYAPVPLLCQ